MPSCPAGSAKFPAQAEWGTQWDTFTVQVNPTQSTSKWDHMNLCFSQEFIVCDEPVDHKGNETALAELEYGCARFGGGQRWEEVEKTRACCRALQCVECAGNRTFLRDGFPCIR